MEPVRSSMSCSPYQSAGLTYQALRSFSPRRYVLDSGGRPKGMPGSAPRSTMRPRHPSSRRVMAALPPASPAPTMTTICSPVALAFIVKNPLVLSSQNRHLKRKEGWEPSAPIRSPASLCTCSTFVVYHIVFRHDHWIVHQNCSDVPTAALLRA